MKPAFDLVIFDWDGTLMDSTGRIVESIAAAGRDLGLPTLNRAEMLNVIGLGLDEAVNTLFPDLDTHTLQHYVDRYRHHFLFTSTEPEQLFDGAQEMIQMLVADGQCSLAVATGKGRKGLTRAFEHTGIGHYFNDSRTADETCSKPNPRMLFELMEALNSTPERTLMVGDTEYDLEMARRAGVVSVAVTYGAHEASRLVDYPVCSTHDNLYSLSNWLMETLSIDKPE